MKQVIGLRREFFGRGLVCISRALLAIMLAGARIFGGYVPFSIGAVAAAGPGWEGLGALIGAVGGALLFLDFSHALRTTACCMLIFTANNAFSELRSYQKRWFLPALTAALFLVVEVIYAVRSGSATEIAHCLIAVLIASFFSDSCRLVLRAKDARHESPSAFFTVLLGLLAAFCSMQFPNGFVPGRIAAGFLVLLLAFDRELSAALAAALGIGLTVDIIACDLTFLHTACYGFSALTTVLLRRSSRVRSAAAFALSTALFALPLEAGEGLLLLYEGLAATLVFLLVPTRILLGIHADAVRSADGEENETGLRHRLRESAFALRELYDSVVHTPPLSEENPAVVYDRAAEAVCRDCMLRERCWVNEYNSTYTALSDATPSLLRRGQGHGEDFPSYFSDRCIRFPSFLSAVNSELHAFFLRRSYRTRLDESLARSAGQFAQFSELLQQTAEASAETEAGEPLLSYQIGMTLRPKEGETVSGDCAGSFETSGGELCLLLSDGMGSGEGARRESSLTVRLVERLLRAGIDATPALRTLNSAMSLRSERSDSFSTVDLLTLSLKNGQGSLYKYGAAPSYIKQGGQVRRVSCSCLPAGLTDEQPPDKTSIRLDRGSYFVMVTDGITDGNDDNWLQGLLGAWEGEDPQELVSSILTESCSHKGLADDAGVLVLRLSEDYAGGAREV